MNQQRSGQRPWARWSSWTEGGVVRVPSISICREKGGGVQVARGAFGEAWERGGAENAESRVPSRGAGGWAGVR